MQVKGNQIFGWIIIKYTHTKQTDIFIDINNYKTTNGERFYSSCSGLAPTAVS